MVDILYVEDNADDADIFSRLLRKYEEPVTYSILTSGSEAIEFLQQAKTLPKLVLLDLNLIGLSGFDVLETIRKNHHTRRLPVVVFSTSDNPSDIRMAYESGVNAYLVKPGTYQATGRLIQRLCQFWLEDNTQTNER
ncbi:response regulator receiver protein [Fibrisoma limi BUZ 3]|uniref:Response regulator receiver protein n=1 Tax=Fibrisoma limi BUZ 3 TaxID=1185876 RepID=I2GC00_9BACT|nr:response regulator [Fibrisoma limi]CCH51424.1 response regulator receiver protein [Fibrisoma limi BUZ 3]